MTARYSAIYDSNADLVLAYSEVERWRVNSARSVNDKHPAWLPAFADLTFSGKQVSDWLLHCITAVRIDLGAVSSAVSGEKLCG
jgi:hypothetical protein